MLLLPACRLIFWSTCTFQPIALPDPQPTPKDPHLREYWGDLETLGLLFGLFIDRCSYYYYYLEKNHCRKRHKDVNIKPASFPLMKTCTASRIDVNMREVVEPVLLRACISSSEIVTLNFPNKTCSTWSDPWLSWSCKYVRYITLFARVQRSKQTEQDSGEPAKSWQVHSTRKTHQHYLVVYQR
jgi:hypothetical protein